jgi:hypothetical protein
MAINGAAHDDPQHWTAEYAFAHLKQTFDQVAKYHPDMLEPFLNRLADADERTQTSVMREGLRDTFRLRHHSKHEQS